MRRNCLLMSHKILLGCTHNKDEALKTQHHGFRHFFAATFRLLTWRRKNVSNFNLIKTSVTRQLFGALWQRGILTPSKTTTSACYGDTSDLTVNSLTTPQICPKYPATGSRVRPRLTRTAIFSPKIPGIQVIVNKYDIFHFKQAVPVIPNVKLTSFRNNLSVFSKKQVLCFQHYQRSFRNSYLIRLKSVWASGYTETEPLGA